MNLLPRSKVNPWTKDLLTNGAVTTSHLHAKKSESRHIPNTLHKMHSKWSMKWSEIAQSYLTLCDPMDCSLRGSSVHGIFQARILEWVAIFFSMRSSWSKDWTQVSRIVGRCFTVWATRGLCKSQNYKTALHDTKENLE